MLNPWVDRSAAYGPAEQAVLNRAGCAAAMQEIGGCPRYAPTPLRELRGLAAAAGIERLWYKDESERFAADNLNSFKALGGAYAVFRLLAREVERRTGMHGVSAANLVRGRHRETVADLTVTCATDGNHGRSVAAGARVFGCRCVIYIHETVSRAREAAIAAFGAEVIRNPGNYDDAIHRAAEEAVRNCWHVVSDTSYPGYTDIPRDVMQGYTVMVEEAVRQLPDGLRPTHVFVQGGVGGLAAAVCGHLWEGWGAGRPFLVVVEPEQAACLLESARQGEPAVVGGDLETIMAGLSCGEPSLLAWQILKPGADAFMTISDDPVPDAMRLLAEGVAGDTPVVAGESAVAGLAGMLLALDEAESRAGLRLGPDSRVLVFGTEGATDPALYERIIGRPAEAVRAEGTDV